MAKFVIVLIVLLVVALVVIDILNAIKYRNEQVRTGIEIAEAKAYWASAKESANVANKRIDELKRALNEQDISTDFITVKRLKEPEEVRPIYAKIGGPQND